jgi:hypothetical protein
MPSVEYVKPLDNYELLLIFDNSEERIFDLKPYLSHGIFRGLKDISLFKTVKVSFDTIEWANGADLCPEVIYKDSRLIN